MIVHPGCFLIVVGVQCRIIEGPQIVSKFLEVFEFAHSREQFLTHDSNNLGASVADQILQGPG